MTNMDSSTIYLLISKGTRRAVLWAPASRKDIEIFTPETRATDESSLLDSKCKGKEEAHLFGDSRNQSRIAFNTISSSIYIYIYIYLCVCAYMSAKLASH